MNLFDCSDPLLAGTAMAAPEVNSDSGYMSVGMGRMADTADTMRSIREKKPLIIGIVLAAVGVAVVLVWLVVWFTVLKGMVACLQGSI